MPGRNYHPQHKNFKDGSPLEPADLNKIIAELMDLRREVEHVEHGGGFWLKITGAPDGNGGYPWTELHFGPIFQPEDSPVSATSAQDPVYEVNGSLDLPASSKPFFARRSIASGELVIDATGMMCCALSPSGGIPAMSGLSPQSANCTLYQMGPTTLTSLGSFEVWNNMLTAVGGSKNLIVGMVDGKWFVLPEDC